MEYLIKEKDNNDNFGMAIALSTSSATDGGGGTDCPRLGCCPRGGRSVPQYPYGN